MSVRNSWLSWIVFLGGLWLIISPAVLGYSFIGSAATNDVIVGVVVAALAFVNAIWSRATARWLSWIIALVGVWEIAAPFLLGYSGTTAALTNSIILGIGIVILSAVQALTVEREAAAGMGTAFYAQERPKKKEAEKETEREG